MNRPRIRNKGLPRRMIYSHGAYYYLQPIGERRNKHVRLAKTLPEALRAYAAIVEGGPSVHVHSMAACVDDWLSHPRGLAKFASRTQGEYRRMAAHIKRWFDVTDMRELETHHVGQVLDYYFASKARAYNAYRSLLSIILRHGIYRGMLDADPAAGVPPMATRARKRYLTDAELDAIRSGAMTGDDGRPNPSGPMIVAIIDMAYVTTQRVGDLRRLTWGDFEGGRMAVQPEKTRDSSGVRLRFRATSDVLDILQRARMSGAKMGATVFRTQEGKPLTYSAIRSAWDRACARAGVADATFHDLKRKSVTDGERAGRNMQLAAGHTTRKMTERYLQGVREVEVDPIPLRKAG